MRVCVCVCVFVSVCRQNSIGAEGAKLISSALQQLKQLTSLNLDL